MILSVVGLCALSAGAQVFNAAWQASGTANENVTAIRFNSTGHVIEVITGGGSVVIGADTLPYTASSYLASYSTDGTLDWVVPVGAQLLLAGYLRRSALAVTDDDTIHFAGTFTGEGMVGDTLLSAPGLNLFLATFTSGGDLVRVRIIGNELRPLALEPAPGGDLVLGATSFNTNFMIGSTALTNYGNQGVDILMARMDRHGNIIWYDQSGGPGFYSDNLADLAVHPDGAISLTGRIRSDAVFDAILQTVPSVNPHGFVARYDAGGAAQWVKLFGYEPEAVDVDADGNCYVLGSGGSHIDTADIISGNYAGSHYLASIDNVGEVNWVLYPDDGNIGFAHDVVVNADGDAWVAGYHRTLLSVSSLATSASGNNAWMVHKTDRFGTAEWVSLSGSANATSNIEALCIAVDGDCGVAVGGTYSTTGPWTIWAVNVPASTNFNALTTILDGCDIVTGIVPSVALDREWSIHPNPATGQFNIDLPDDARGNLRIMDAQGRSYLDRQLHDDARTIDLMMVPGLYLVTWSSVEGCSSRRLVVE